MAKEQNTPSHVHVELALLALQEATSRVRFIEQNDFTSEFRDHLPAVLQDLSRASYYLNNLKTVTPIHGALDLTTDSNRIESAVAIYPAS